MVLIWYVLYFCKACKNPRREKFVRNEYSFPACLIAMSCLLNKKRGFKILPSVFIKINGCRMIAMAKCLCIMYSEVATIGEFLRDTVKWSPMPRSV